MYEVYYASDLGSRSTTGYRYVGLQQPGRDLFGVRLIFFIGCDTAGYPGDTLLLLSLRAPHLNLAKLR
jgi:hypothetical protein